MRNTLAILLPALLATPLLAQTPVPANSDYDAAARVFPEEACPSWQAVVSASPERPSLVTDALRLDTSGHSENMFFIQTAEVLDLPDPFVIEFRARYVTGSSGSNARAPLSVVVDLGFNEGTSFFIGSGEVFVNDAQSRRGPTAAVDTASLHTYRLEIHGGGLVEVFYDDAFLMQSATYVSYSDFGADPRIFWGEASSATYGITEWAFFRHNGHATGCPDVDDDGDGALVDVDCDDDDALSYPGAVEVYDGRDNDCDGLVDEDLDHDLDGIPDFNDACPDTLDGTGVGPDGCSACALDPDDDGDGYPQSVDCDDADPAVHPGALDVCNGIDDDCDGVVDPLADGDADGYGVCTEPEPDCDDTDPGVHPGAVELPGNRVDENCDGVLACDPRARWKSKGQFLRCVIGDLIRLRSSGTIDRATASDAFRSAVRRH